MASSLTSSKNLQPSENSSFCLTPSSVMNSFSPIVAHSPVGQIFSVQNVNTAFCSWLPINKGGPFPSSWLHYILHGILSHFIRIDGSKLFGSL